MLVMFAPATMIAVLVAFVMIVLVAMCLVCLSVCCGRYVCYVCLIVRCVISGIVITCGVCVFCLSCQAL